MLFDGLTRNILTRVPASVPAYNLIIEWHKTTCAVRKIDVACKPNEDSIYGTHEFFQNNDAPL